MRRPTSSRSLPRPLAAGALLCILAAAGAAADPKAGGGGQLRAWSEGPVRWLLLPEERRRLRRIRSSVSAVNFIEDFWSRRDPDPDDEVNPVREAFHRRVDAADQLYAEPNRRGSLSDRGGALILLGSPSHLHIGSRPVLSWDPAERGGDRVASESQSFEIWGYRLDELPPALGRMLRERQSDEVVRLQVVFVRGKERTYMTDGKTLLELAARALVAAPD